MTDRGYERISLDNERSGSIRKQTIRIETYGHRRVMREVWSSSQDSKTEALVAAQVRLEAAQTAFLADLSDEQEEDALSDLRAAKAAIRAAQALPSARTASQPLLEPLTMPVGSQSDTQADDGTILLRQETEKSPPQ